MAIGGSAGERGGRAREEAIEFARQAREAFALAGRYLVHGLGIFLRESHC